MFITFEGIDGCGKTTQLNLLQKYLEKAGYKVLATREPGITPLAEKLRGVLLSLYNDIPELSEMLLFEAARVELVDKVIRPTLLNNTIVLSDRYYDSTTAYQGGGREQNIETIKILNKIAVRDVIPDITFFMDVPYSLSLERRFVTISDRIEASGIDFYERVIAAYRAITAEEPDRVKVIDATGSIEEISNNIIQIVKSKLFQL